MFSKKFLTGVALTAMAFAVNSGFAFAQSTASQIQDEEIVVTGLRQSVDGVISAEQAAKARSTITQDFIDQQAPGQSILSTINLIPGVSFTNNDPYGSSGGNIRMRGFDGNRISLTFDGVPLNDTGNYAIFSNQMLDPELIQRASVSMGTTDVDSPTASATGGTINYVTRLPDEEFGLKVQPSVGSENYFRVLTEIDTGQMGPLNTSAFGAVSFQSYDQFIGSGDLEKLQLNARVYQPLNGDDFMSLAFHWNRNRNSFYRQGSIVSTVVGVPSEWAHYGDLANLSTCTRGVENPTTRVTNDGATIDTLVRNTANPNAPYLNANDNPINPASCTNYQGLRINPSNTGNIRGQSRFSFGEHLTLTVDPTVQYVLANGGGTTVVSETDARLRAGALLGVDLNGDGDTLDSIRLYSPSNTNTVRYAILSSLLWELNDSHRFIVGYTYDTGRHRQTGEYGLLNSSGDPQDVFGGKQGQGAPILTRAGTVFQKRNRLSVATLSQFSARYIGDFMNDALTIDLGVRAPEFERSLDQRCYTIAASTGDPTCATGFVPAGVAPFQASVSYDDILPSAGLVIRPGEDHQIFLSYAAGLSAPRTDDLYNGITVAQLDNVEPETSQAYDVGYRYQGDGLLLSTTAWFNAFQNRIVRVFDQLEGINIARNIGDVDLWGAELQAGWQATESLSAYVSLAYTDSEVKENLPISATTFAATAGKQLVETPDWTLSGRLEYENGPFTLGLQGKFVGDRWATDVNDQVAPAYTTFDLDARWDLGEASGNKRTYFQLNVLNLFDEDYFGSFGSQVATTGPGAGTTRYNVGASRTVQLTMRAEF